MIHTIRTVTVDSKKSVIDSPIVLYRGDREVEIEFSLVGSKFTFSEGGNVIKSLNAAYGQLIIHSPNPNIDIVFSEITECNDGKVVFLITKEMIDELVEVGTYDFQIRLYDATQVSRATIPPISQALDIRHPIGSEEETNVVDIAIAEYSVVRDDPFENVMTFLPNGDYNKTEWASNALITAARMNKIEDGLHTVNRNMEVSDTNLFNRIEKVNNNLSARLNNLGDEIATEAMDSFSDQIAQLKGAVNASILASESKVTAEMDATKESVNAEIEAFDETFNAELEAFEETFNAEWESTRTTIEETKAAIDEAKVTVDETQSVVTELIDETRETVSSFEGRINALDIAYKAADVEIQNSIPTNVSQLENDSKYATEEYVEDAARHNTNLIRNSGFAGALPNANGKSVRDWTIDGSLKVYNIPYTSDGKLILTPTKVASPGSIYQDFYIDKSFAGVQLTWSFYCDWQKNIEPPLYVIDVFNTSTEKIYNESEFCTVGNNTITFTVPSVGDLSYITIGIVTNNGLKPENGGSYIKMSIGNMKLEYGDKVTPWCPHPQDNLLIPQSGGWFNNGTPIVGASGTMDIGSILDFHSGNNATGDYNFRFYNWDDGNLYTYGAIVPRSNGSSDTLGRSNIRWSNIYLTGNPNVSSDRNMKENIEYVRNENVRSVSTDEVITYSDMYDFVKDDLELAAYNFKTDDNKEQKMNFIAQDLLYNSDGSNNKVGQMIVKPVAVPTEEEVEERKSRLKEDDMYEDPTLSYDMGMYISVLAGALKEALNKIEKLEARIDELENK